MLTRLNLDFRPPLLNSLNRRPNQESRWGQGGTLKPSASIHLVYLPKVQLKTAQPFSQVLSPLLRVSVRYVEPPGYSSMRPIVSLRRKQAQAPEDRLRQVMFPSRPCVGGPEATHRTSYDNPRASYNDKTASSFLRSHGNIASPYMMHDGGSVPRTPSGQVLPSPFMDHDRWGDTFNDSKDPAQIYEEPLWPCLEMKQVCSSCPRDCPFQR